jgi:uncharacterized membrane protein
VAVRAEKHARGASADAVVWEEVEARTDEQVELSATFLAFMVLAALIAAVGIYQDSAILIVGAMVVGFPFAIVAVSPRPSPSRRPASCRTTSISRHQLSNIIASPDFLAFFVAACAGAAGMLSLSTAKSGALIGVLISVTTIPAAANIGVTAAYADWENWRGSIAQLALNMGAILVAGTATLAIQRALYNQRRRRHEAVIG